MSLPSEYVIEDAVRSVDDVIVYRANHPIHGTVSVYLPDDTLPIKSVRLVRKHLYQNGLQMRNLSLLNIPFVAKALEVSQNPNEPYIVTKYAEHDLEEFISNGVTTKPKRIFTILSQILQAMVNLSANKWEIAHLHPRQIKLSELHTGDISITVIEGTNLQVGAIKTDDTLETKYSKINTKPMSQIDVEKNKTIGSIEGIQTQEDLSLSSMKDDGVDQTATLDRNALFDDGQKLRRNKQRNIYILGNITYQLLFGRKYSSADKAALANIRTIARRWRKILEKALDQDIDYRYSEYEAVLSDVNKALNRNKRTAITSIPFFLLLVAIGSYYAYERYHKYKIMKSEAGQAIKSFLDVVSKTDNEFPELKKPEPIPTRPDDKTILKPFDKIEPLGED